MDKKQIEEMAKDIDSIFPYNKAIGNLPQWLAIELKKQGYRKINENEVVISKEEYETKKEIVANWGFLQQEIMQGKFVAIADLEKDGKVIISKEEYKNDFSNQFNKGYENGCKETARKILERGKYCMPSGLREWIIKQYGVEIGEEK